MDRNLNYIWPFGQHFKKYIKNINETYEIQTYAQQLHTIITSYIPQIKL